MLCIARLPATQYQIHILAGALDHQQASHEWLIGWQGESYSPVETWQQQQQQRDLLTDTDTLAAAAAAQPPAAAPASTPRVIDLSQQRSQIGKRW